MEVEEGVCGLRTEAGLEREVRGALDLGQEGVGVREVYAIYLVGGKC